jgi:hypothetical protein
MNNQEQNQECCPKFNPDTWDGKAFEWESKKFIKDKVSTFFYIPITFGLTMKRMNERVEKAGAKMPDWLCLSDHTSKWNMDLYLAVDKEVSGAENTTLSGNFFSKVYEGNFKNTSKWKKDFKNYAKDRGMNIKKFIFGILLVQNVLKNMAKTTSLLWRKYSLFEFDLSILQKRIK